MKYEPREMFWPPDLGSKLIDWQILAVAGGEGLFRGKDVLELGPCYGVDAFMFAHLANRYEVLDSDPHVVAWIRERVQEAVVNQGDFAAMPFVPESFDTVIDFSSIDNSDRVWAAYLEAGRVLRPGGVLVTTFANDMLVTTRPHETPSSPITLRRDLEALGFVFRGALNWHDTRAALAMVKS